jgi:hypothetical protein
MTASRPGSARALLVLAAALSLVCLLSACRGAVRSGDDVGRVQHVVLFWLKEPGKADARHVLMEAALSLSDLPGVLSIRAAEALPGTGPIVDGSFDVLVVTSFSDRPALEAFLEHPTHKQVDKEVVQPLVSRVLVYNAVE